MIVFGKDYGMMLTVGATSEIEELIPTHNLADLGDILQGTYTSLLKIVPRLLTILNSGYVDYMSLMHPAEDVAVFNVDERNFRIMSPGDINDMMHDIGEIINNGMERSVIAEAIPAKNE